MPGHRKLWLSGFAALLILLAFSRAIDHLGSDNTEQALVRALATYAVARALNGVISVAQGTEVAIEPAGVGVILTPGQILDPVNDLIERFSWVMLVSSASLGILNVLLSISAWIWLSVIMTAALLAMLYLQWAGSSRLSGTAITMVNRLVVLLVIVRFAAPAIAISSDLIYQQFLEPRYQTAITRLEKTTERIVEISNDTVPTDLPVPVDDDASLLDKAKQLYESAARSITQKIDMQQRMQRYESAASDASRHAIDLIVVFVLQTILLPVFFLWVVWQLLKWVMRGGIKV
jgi:hypothetical protein